ncbi:MAG: hypothetical protein CLLPBCKN_007062 [Chroococcidiopsis cubana SAG 39.79]|uniref:Uncharacterized protein n=1 Tax=Chroococcidiopsis cubana SAG 39.79 TaxID=388085 RepID=A0AB37U9V1_9CYAN|nr:hypothetical protein [Chroococcidiopsis cubana]MDZ4877627.1 hypothetical protein [Chroococcidiopsis cubana SAG 39.79]PSB62125.1 hypothetical protein C7B79_19300 [Chroococcidiopsis cubana CCALA 043]RUT00889.1 hypothetical protein DSM107010_66910 [Chroococcidiopsis cubana SAG 39.79]
MKFKFKTIAFCLATSALIVPVPKALSAGALHHVKKEEKRLNWVCVQETQNSWKCQFKNSQLKNSQQPKAIDRSKSTLAKSASNSTLQLDMFLLLTFIGSISMGLFLYIWHRNKRIAKQQKIIKFLERCKEISYYQGK